MNIELHDYDIYPKVHPIVGSIDSHCPYDNNRNYDICSTIVFAHENERGELLTSIKDGYRWQWIRSQRSIAW